MMQKYRLRYEENLLNIRAKAAKDQKDAAEYRRNFPKSMYL